MGVLKLSFPNSIVEDIMQEITQLILDFQKRKLPDLLNREMKISELPNAAIVITGARRSGKTYRTYQYISDLIAGGLQIENICRIQFNDNRLLNLTVGELNSITDSYYALYPEKYNVENVYFVFDEIHRIAGWEDYILALLDNPLHKVLITGSTSKLQSGEIASALRGKCIPHQLFPFSFKEYLAYRKIDFIKYDSKTIALLRKHIRLYLELGGFPGLYGLDEFKHLEMLQNYWDTMLLKDIIEAHPATRINVLSLTKFAAGLISRNACPMTITNIIKELKDYGVGVSEETIYKYLHYLEEAFMVYTVCFHSKSQKIIDRNYKKIYSVDWALADAVCSGEGMTDSRRLENLVFLQLKRKFRKISYFKTREGYEVDFVTSNKESSRPELYQVSVSIKNKDVREREIRALTQSGVFLKANKCFIITLDDPQEIIKTDELDIVSIPVWKWLTEN